MQPTRKPRTVKKIKEAGINFIMSGLHPVIPELKYYEPPKPVKLVDKKEFRKVK